MVSTQMHPWRCSQVVDRAPAVDAAAAIDAGADDAATTVWSVFSIKARRPIAVTDIQDNDVFIQNRWRTTFWRHLNVIFEATSEAAAADAACGAPDAAAAPAVPYAAAALLLALLLTLELVLTLLL